LVGTVEREPRLASFASPEKTAANHSVKEKGRRLEGCLPLESTEGGTVRLPGWYLYVPAGDEGAACLDYINICSRQGGREEGCPLLSRARLGGRSSGKVGVPSILLKTRSRATEAANGPAPKTTSLLSVRQRGTRVLCQQKGPSCTQSARTSRLFEVADLEAQSRRVRCQMGRGYLYLDAKGGIRSSVDARDEALARREPRESGRTSPSAFLREGKKKSLRLATNEREG